MKVQYIVYVTDCIHLYDVGSWEREQDMLPQILVCQRQLYFPSDPKLILIVLRQSVVRVPTKSKTIALFINSATAGNYYKYHMCEVTSLPSCNLELAYSYQRSDSDAGRLAPKL